MFVDEYEFRIRLAPTGEVFTVPADKSIVEVLREILSELRVAI